MKSAILVANLLILASMIPVHAAVPSDMEIETHRLVNEVRLDKDKHDRDLVALRLHSVLIDVARAHSQDMLEREYFDHVSPEGDSVADRVTAAGVDYQVVGENLFFIEGADSKDVPRESVDGWVSSPGHYANILTEYAFTGIGIASSQGVYYVTQVFISADTGHLRSIGRIFENDELDDINVEDDKGIFGIEFNAGLGAGIVILLVVLIGIDASRRNNRYYRR